MSVRVEVDPSTAQRTFPGSRGGRLRFGVGRRPHRTPRVVQHLRGHRADEQRSESSESVSRHHDQIHVVTVREVDDSKRGIAALRHADALQIRQIEVRLIPLRIGGRRCRFDRRRDDVQGSDARAELSGQSADVRRDDAALRRTVKREKDVPEHQHGYRLARTRSPS
jgi:hypothetical protein